MTTAADSPLPAGAPAAPEGDAVPEAPAELSRRSFLTYLLGLAGALGLAGLLAPIIRYAYPVVTTTAPEGDAAPEAPAELSRRSFLTYLLGLAGALGLAGLLAPIIRYAYPVVTTTAPEKLKVADLATLQPLGEAVYFDYQDSPSALILLADGTPKAYSLVCTHFGCIVKWVPADKDFFCPCHAGRFGPDGKVLSGPPPKPLTELKVVKDGTVIYVEGTV